MEEKIFEDIATRRLMTDPQSMFTGEKFQESLRSLTPDIAAKSRPVPPAGATIRDIAKLGMEELDPRSASFIGEKGGFVKMGGLGGLDNVFIPGREAITQLAAYRTPGEQVIQTDLTSGYVNFLESARAASRGRGGMDDFIARRDELSNLLVRAHKGTITGPGGIGRGGLVGSRFFTGVAPVNANTSADIFRIGVSESYFGNMFSEMRAAAETRTDLGATGKEAYLAQLETMKSKFMAGEEIGGYLTRHPFIGEHSLMPVRYRLDKKLSDAVVSMPTVHKMITVNGKAEKINWSVAAGLAGDFDADIYGAILADPRHEMDIAGMAKMGSPFSKRYASFAIRHQLMKIRSATEDIVDPMRAQTDEAMKMAVSGRIGEISFEMSKARAALIKQGVTEKTSDAMFLLEWLEQNPISGKHLKSEMVGQLDPMITDIVESVRRGDVSGLGNVIRQMVDPEKLTMLGQDIEANIPGVGDIRASGLNIDETVGTIQSALSGFREEEGMLSPLREHVMTRAKKMKFKTKDIVDYLSAYQHSVFSPMVSGPEVGMMASVSRKGMKAMGGLARGLMDNWKPIGIGLGASLALSSALSFPRRSVGGAPTVYAPMGSNTGDSVNRENIHPDRRVMGQPTPPNMPGPPPTPIELNQPQPSMSAMVRVRGRMPGQFNPGGLNENIRNSLGGRTSVSSRISDDRSIMTADKLDSILNR